MSPTLNHQPNFNWQEIETVLLDMDGTLLDLEFDSYFWLNLVPQTLSERRGITLDEAKKLIRHEYNAVQHTLNWYCFDYWSDRLDLDIYQMTSEVGARARLRQDTQPFLEALRASGRKTILLTNAHPHGLAVKLQHTDSISILIYYFPPTHLVIRRKISDCGRRYKNVLVLILQLRCLSMMPNPFWMQPKAMVFATALGFATRTQAWPRSNSHAIRP